MLKGLLSALVALTLLAAVGDHATVPKPGPRQWPLIEPLSWSGRMNLLGPPTLIPIRSTTGAVLYRLYCSSWASVDDTQPEWLTAGDNYEGDFECLLTDVQPGTPAPRATLLNYDPQDTSPYHFNEGSFHWHELLGGCWDNAEWGADRTFYLRGMRLRIRVIRITVEEFWRDKMNKDIHPVISSVTAEVNAQPDPSATTALARRPRRNEPNACPEGP